MEEVFDLDAFIAGINNDKTKGGNGDVKKKLNRLLMNTKDTTGTLTFIPCYSRGIKNFYLKLSNVFEFNAYTSILDDDAWYRVLPIEYYGELTQDQIELYEEVKGYLEYLKDEDVLDYSELRTRTYSIFPGIMLKLKNTQKKENKELVNCACLFVYPSPNPINGLCNAINTKIDNIGSKEWITKVLTPKATGRRGAVQITFVPKESGQVGYDCSVSFEMNNSDEGIIVVDPDYEISEEMMSRFDDIMPTFLGWTYDRDNNSYFNVEVFKELRDHLKLKVKELEGETTETKAESDDSNLENKNNLTPKEEVKEEVKPSDEAPTPPTGTTRKTPF